MNRLDKIAAWYLPHYLKLDRPEKDRLVLIWNGTTLGLSGLVFLFLFNGYFTVHSPDPLGDLLSWQYWALASIFGMMSIAGFTMRGVGIRLPKISK